MTMARALLELRGGVTTFDQFVRATLPQWRALATRLFRRWTPPTGYSVEDTTQDLLLAAWPLVAKWDPSRGVAIDRYVVWNASDKAKKTLHRMRGANRSGSSDKNPSRGEVLRFDGDQEHSPTIDPQTNRIERRQIAKMLASNQSEVEATVLLLLAELDGWEIVAMKIYEQPETRRRFRLGNESQARALVRKIIVATATRVAAQAA